jgi:hypothetical protein
MPKLPVNKESSRTPTKMTNCTNASNGSKSKDLANRKSNSESDELGFDSLSLESNTTMARGEVVHRCSSEYIGDVLVEELPSKSVGGIVRRMRFVSNLDLEQTEVRLVMKMQPNGISELVAEENYLPYMW